MTKPDCNQRNNCRSNLRVCTRQETSHNRAKRIGSSSQFKGVRHDKNCDKWRAGIWFNGQNLGLGTFGDEVGAARAYDRAAVECFGEFAYLNFPEDWPPERRREAFAKKETVHELLKAKAERAKRRKAKSKGARGKTRNK